jgi:hypothetical protein
METEMAQIMTDREKAAITMKAIALRNAGKESEALALKKTIPMPPFLAKFWKDHIGTDGLLQLGWNLSEAEAVFGQDWLAR